VRTIVAMLTLSSALQAAQASPRRAPAVAVALRPQRFGVPVLFPASIGNTAADPDTQLSLAVHPTDESKLLAVRTNGTALDFQRTYPNIGTWTNLDTVSAGQGFQLAYDSASAVFGLAYGDSTAVKFRTTADGITWSAATTLVTEASAIGAVALAFDDIGDACVFYVVGTSTTLKRLRRSSGTWAASGTTWTLSGSVANLTGLAAVWDGDFNLAITGLAVTTLHRRVWAAKMGDQILPLNAWTTLRSIAEADAASGVTFAHPSLINASGVFFATFQRTEAGNVAVNRPFLTHTNPVGGFLGYWAEPRPIPGVTTTHGAALAYYPSDGDHSSIFIVGSRKPTVSKLFPQDDLTDRVVALRYRVTPSSLSLRLELDNHDGAARFGPNQTIYPGMDLAVSFGYRLADGSASYGASALANIHRITDQLAPGKHRLILEASGPWEAMERYRAPSAWTAPASTTRANIFARVAAAAGIGVSSASGSRAPSTAWTTDTPTFAIAANETGAATLERLLTPTPDFLRPAFGSGGFQMCGSLTDTSVMAHYALPAAAYGGSLPLLEAETIDALAPNWARLQGPDRYADSYLESSTLDYEHILTRGPMARLVRDRDASTDALANARAAAARQRSRQLEPRARAVTVAHVGHELFDVVRLHWNLNPADGLEDATHRVIGLTIDYRAAPAAGAAAYTATLDLAETGAFT